MDLNTPLEKAGPKYRLYATRVKKLNITTLNDLIFHLPFRYEDRSLVSKIAYIQPSESLTIQGKVITIKNTYTRKRGFTIQTALVEDETGTITCTWFNQPYVSRAIQEGSTVSIAGTAESNKKIVVKDFEVLYQGKNSIHTGRLVPQYPSTKNVSPKWLRGRISEILNNLETLPDPLPQEILTEYNLTNLLDALKKIHFPKQMEEAEIGRKRLAFDELLTLNLASEVQKKEWRETNTTAPLTTKGHEKELKKLYDSLPFTLTPGQLQAVESITKDLSSKTPMNRLLQGDVGSGKTVVAAIAMYIAYLNKAQSALMAPTEILAHQHFETISKLLSPLGVKVALATSSKKIGLNDNLDFDIIIGTHALLNKKVTFKNLGLITIDEQQRFGVEQRGILREKGNKPHFLTMTATPIPRTVFLAMHGELDFSYLDTLPKGRKKIKTWVVPKEKRDSAYKWIVDHIKDGKKQNTQNQAFILCPFIEESETLTSVRAATKEYETLAKGPFKNLKVALLHGKMKASEKEKILQDFRNHKYDVLVTTPVVEVGIDIPDATIMLIEGADRFGLAQLHQLRGRVGRNDREAYCLLFSDTEEDGKINRLKYLETMSLGSDLAEIDLKIRGPGEMYGTRQSGRLMFKVAQVTDTEILRDTQIAAKKLASRLEEFPQLHTTLKSTIIRKISRD